MELSTNALLLLSHQRKTVSDHLFSESIIFRGYDLLECWIPVERLVIGSTLK